MSTLAQIVMWAIWLIIVVEVTVLIASVIYMHRKRREECDTASKERRTIIDRIERLRKENSGRITNNYIIFNHTRNAVIEDALGYVTKEGGVKITGDPFKIDPKYVAREVRLLVILKDGEDAGGFLGG